MKHKKYKHIDGVWQTKTVEYLRMNGFDHPSIIWCVTEKAHGSNFAFYMNQDEIKVAKRNKFLKEGENFFNYTSMKESNGYKIKQLWDLLVFKEFYVEELVVYGELIGGAYPHPDVEKIPNMTKIQKGVWYCPDIRFYCFDIMLNGEFLPMWFVCDLCEQIGILYAKILQFGSFDECLDHSNEFQTLIPNYLNLPQIEDNICEGVVLKPVNPLFYKDGDRVILKSKNEHFSEVQKEPQQKHIRKVEELSGFGRETLNLLNSYVNENRLRNVLSKIGAFTHKDFRKVFDAFKKDVYEDFNRDYDNLKSLFANEKKKIDQILGKLITEVWRPIFISEDEK